MLLRALCGWVCLWCCFSTVQRSHTASIANYTHFLAVNSFAPHFFNESSRAINLTVWMFRLRRNALNVARMQLSFRLFYLYYWRDSRLCQTRVKRRRRPGCIPLSETNPPDLSFLDETVMRTYTGLNWRDKTRAYTYKSVRILSECYPDRRDPRTIHCTLWAKNPIRAKIHCKRDCFSRKTGRTLMSDQSGAWKIVKSSSRIRPGSYSMFTLTLQFTSHSAYFTLVIGPIIAVLCALLVQLVLPINHRDRILLNKILGTVLFWQYTQLEAFTQTMSKRVFDDVTVLLCVGAISNITLFCWTILATAVLEHFITSTSLSNTGDNAAATADTAAEQNGADLAVDAGKQETGCLLRFDHTISARLETYLLLPKWPANLAVVKKTRLGCLIRLFSLIDRVFATVLLVLILFVLSKKHNWMF